MKSYYNSFDTKIQCEEFYSGYEEWSDDEQQAWEAEQEQLKDWSGGYAPKDEGKSYGAISV